MKIKILEKTLISIGNDSERFANIFYQLLEDEHPVLTIKLAARKREHKHKQLINWLKLVFNYLDRASSFKILLKNMGSKYITLGVTFKDYQIVSDTLLRTVALFLKDKWTMEVEQAWQDFHKISVELMLEGAKEKYSFSNTSNGRILSEVNRLRIEAIIRKAIQENTSTEVLTQRIMKDTYFQKATCYIGREKALEILLELLEKTNRNNIWLKRSA